MRRPTSTRRHSQGETTFTLPHDKELYFVSEVDGMPYLGHQNGEASKRRGLPCPGVFVVTDNFCELGTERHRVPSPRYDECLVPLGESLRLGRTAMSATVAPCRLDASTEPL